MEKIEHRAVIKFLTKQGKSAQMFFQELLVVYVDSAPSKIMVYNWHNLFKQERESFEDDLHSGRPIEATTPEIVAKVERGNIMVTIVWDTESILLMDYKDRGVTITGQYYASLLDRLKEASTCTFVVRSRSRV